MLSNIFLYTFNPAYSQKIYNLEAVLIIIIIIKIQTILSLIFSIFFTTKKAYPTITGLPLSFNTYRFPPT